jgi:hypothetical protein
VVVPDDDAGGIRQERGLEHVARVDDAPVERAAPHLMAADQPVLGGQEQYDAYLYGFAGKTLAEERGRVGRPAYTWKRTGPGARCVDDPKFANAAPHTRLLRICGKGSAAQTASD